MSKIGKVLLAMSLFSSSAEERDYLRHIEYNPRKSEPYWKRKKCKSCDRFTMNIKECSKNPNHNACSTYNKRK